MGSFNKKDVSLHFDHIIKISGEKNRGFYAIGYPTHGSVLIANSIELLRQSAKKIATNLVKETNEEV